MIGKNSIQSRGLLSYRGFPIKVYSFAAGFGELYGTTEGALRHVSETIARNDGVLRDPSSKLKNLYGIAFPWGEFGNMTMARRNLDLSVFAFDAPFEDCNPEVYMHNFSNGVLTSGPNKFCETGLAILGEEAKDRRLLVSLCLGQKKYLESWANLRDLGPIDSKIENLII